MEILRDMKRSGKENEGGDQVESGVEVMAGRFDERGEECVGGGSA